MSSVSAVTIKSPCTLRALYSSPGDVRFELSQTSPQLLSTKQISFCEPERSSGIRPHVHKRKTSDVKLTKSHMISRFTTNVNLCTSLRMNLDRVCAIGRSSNANGSRVAEYRKSPTHCTGTALVIREEEPKFRTPNCSCSAAAICSSRCNCTMRGTTRRRKDVPKTHAALPVCQISFLPTRALSPKEDI